MYVFLKSLQISKLSITALEQHCIIELPAIMKMFHICTIQYRSPMWLQSYLKKYAGFMTLVRFPDSASPVEGPSVCILNKFPGWYFCAVKLGRSLICATGNKGTPTLLFSGGLQIEMTGVRESFMGRGHGDGQAEEQNCFDVYMSLNGGPPLMKPFLILSAGGGFP